MCHESIKEPLDTLIVTIALTINMEVVATLLLEEWEDDIHTPEMGTWESTGTPKTSKFDFKGQNTSHWIENQPDLVCASGVR